MDEIKDIIVNLKMESKILTMLIDTILDSCGIRYGGGLRIEDDDKILTIVKTFYPAEYMNALNELKRKSED